MKQPPAWVLCSSWWGTNFAFILLEKQRGGSEAPTLGAAEAWVHLGAGRNVAFETLRCEKSFIIALDGPFIRGKHGI